jgi:hypothetical protein
MDQKNIQIPKNAAANIAISAQLRSMNLFIRPQKYNHPTL